MRTWKHRRLALSLTRMVCCLLLSIVVEVFGVSFLSRSQAEIIDLQGTRFGRVVGESINSAIKGAVCPIHNCDVSSTMAFNTDNADIRADFEVTFKELCGKVRGKKLCAPPLSLVKTAKTYFIYNLHTQTYSGQYQFTFQSLKAKGKALGVPYSFSYTPPPYKISLATIESLIEGELSLEEIAELIPNPLPNLFRPDPDNDYEKVKQEYTSRWGAANIYFASSDFVKWASPLNRTGEWGAALLLTGGAAAEPIMKQIEAKLREEWMEILNWLEGKTELQAGALLEMIFRRERFTWPHLAAVFQPVQYRQQYYFFGKHIPKFDWSQNHAAFVLIWQWGNPQTLDQFVKARIDEFERYVADELCQRLKGKVSCEEIRRNFASHGMDQTLSEIATNLYREVHGQNAVPTGSEVTEIIEGLTNGFSYAEVQEKVKARYLALLRKKRAIQFLLTHYMTSRSKQ